MTSDVLIVGASLGGLRCATGLRRAGFDGSITILGDEPHKPYDRPPLSKQFLAGDWDASRLQLTQDDAWTELDLDFRPSTTAVGLDVETKSIVLGNGASLSAESIVIATGAQPRRLPGMEAMTGVHVLRTLDDATAIAAELAGGSKNVVVIGAGFIGAEVAATAHQGGHHVVLLEAAAVPMERGLGPTIGAICGQLHVDEGIDLRLSTRVARLHGADRVESVELGDGSIILADVVVVGIGVVPNTGWLDGSSLTIDNGVLTNEFCEAAPGIYAVGDVANFPNHAFAGEMMRVEHWENAVEQGTYVGKRIAGASDGEPFAPVPWFWSDQHSYKIQLAGRPRGTDEMAIITGSIEEKRFAALFGRSGSLTGVFGLNRPRHVMKYRRMIADGVSWEDALAGEST